METQTQITVTRPAPIRITRRRRNAEPQTIGEKLERELQEQRRKLVISGGTQREILAQIVENTINELSEKRTETGQIMLAGMWLIHSEQLYRDRGYDKFMTWASSELGAYDDNQYERELALVVDRVFAPVDDAHKQGRPYTDADGAIITAERLSETKGLIYKLKVSSDAIARSIENGDDAHYNMLKLIVSGTRDQVEQARNDYIRPPQLTIQGYQRIESDGTVSMFFPGLTPAHLAMMDAQMGKLWDLSFDAAPALPAGTKIEAVDWPKVAQSLASARGRKKHMQTSLGDLQRTEPTAATKLRISIVVALENAPIGYTKAQRINLYSTLFGRPITTSNSLSRAEAEVLSELLTQPAFRQSMEMKDERQAQPVTGICRDP